MLPFLELCHVKNAGLSSRRSEQPKTIQNIDGSSDTHHCTPGQMHPRACPCRTGERLESFAQISSESWKFSRGSWWGPRCRGRGWRHHRPTFKPTEVLFPSPYVLSLSLPCFCQPLPCSQPPAYQHTRAPLPLYPKTRATDCSPALISSQRAQGEPLNHREHPLCSQRGFS